jgi:hypothetical protein
MLNHKPPRKSKPRINRGCFFSIIDFFNGLRTANKKGGQKAASDLFNSIYIKNLRTTMEKEPD